jgi:hypothetical protein
LHWAAIRTIDVPPPKTKARRTIGFGAEFNLVIGILHRTNETPSDITQRFRSFRVPFGAEIAMIWR